MAFFDNASEKLRKQNLKTLEDKRIAFAKRVNGMNLTPDFMLYSQNGGGFTGMGMSGKKYIYITGPAPAEEADFSIMAYDHVDIQTREILIESEGMGGMFGFGKKGGVGYVITLSFPDGMTGELSVVSNQNCILEAARGKDSLFDEKRRHGNSNFVWEFRPLEDKRINAIVERFLKAMGDEL